MSNISNENTLNAEIIMKNQNERPAVTATDLKRGDDNINVYYVKPNGEPWGNSARYYNLNAAKKNFDQGFLKELVINYSPLEDPQNKIWSASKILHDYLHIPYGKRQEQFKERLENYTVNRNSNSLMQPIGVDDPKILPSPNGSFSNIEPRRTARTIPISLAGAI